MKVEPSRAAYAVGTEVELGPRAGEDARGDGPTRDTGDALKLGQEAELVEPPDGSSVEEHRT